MVTCRLSLEPFPKRPSMRTSERGAFATVAEVRFVCFHAPCVACTAPSAKVSRLDLIRQRGPMKLSDKNDVFAKRISVAQDLAVVHQRTGHNLESAFLTAA